MTGSRIRIILYTVAAIISLAGLAEATYLTVLYLTGETAVCGGSADCFRVLGSAYARIAGIPVAAFGILAYFSAFAFATFAAFGYASARTLLALIVWATFGVRSGSCLCKRSCFMHSAVTVCSQPRSSSSWPLWSSLLRLQTEYASTQIATLDPLTLRRD